MYIKSHSGISYKSINNVTMHVIIRSRNVNVKTGTGMGGVQGRKKERK
jgi:hypothetical protein